MLKRVLWLLLAFPAAVILIALAVANRHSVRLVLDPFRPESPVLSLVLPFYAYLFGALLVGVVIGAISTWVGQGPWRRYARTRGRDASRWQAEAERLTRERDAELSGDKRLLTARR